MKIEALRLFNVRRFANRGVAIEGIGDGVNVLCAANEFGKSTSFEALHALFFQAHSGAPKDVKRLQPYSGGNPLIEADIETEAGRFRLAKQFLGSRRATVTDLSTGRLIAQADEAESFIAGLTRGGAGGPSGLLWVRQGITGIEDRDKSEREEERRVRQSLLESVQGEVEAVTGGRRMAEIMEAVVGELGRLVTATGRPKSGSAYEAALEERKRLAAEETRLEGEVKQLRQALDQRAEAAKRLADLEQADEKRERRKAVEDAERAFELARAHGEALRTAEMEARLARSRSDAARLEHTTYRDALAAHADLQNRLSEVEAIRQRAAESRRAAGEGLDRAMAEADAAEEEEREARALLSRLDAALKARDAAERHAAAEKRLSEVEALRQAIEAAEAALALVAIPAKTVERLRTLELEIARLSAAEEARQPTLSMDYLPDATVRLALDGVPLEAGSEHGFGALARVEIPGIGTLRLRANRGSEANGRLAEARSQRSELLASLAVASLREATEREADAARQTAALERLRARFDALAPEGLPKLRAEVARLAAPLSEPSALPLELKADPDAMRQAVERAGERVAATRGALREAQPARMRAEQALTEAQSSLAMLGSERARLDAMLGPAPGRVERERDLAAEAAKALVDATEADARTAALHDAAPDLQNAEAALRRARSVEESAVKEANALRERLAALNENVRFHSDEAVEERWRETVDAHMAIDGRVKALEKEIAVLTRLQATLQAARSAARDLYLKPVMTELRPLLSLLFDDVSISFDEKTLLPHTITRAGAEEDVDRLSGGMREQLSILTRLAFARLLARDGRPAPVILDDALVYSDDDRIERMFDALHRQAREQQIIVFSCRQRAFSRLGGNVLSMSDWTPA